ncbi:MAG TPA: glycoside hydrolase family 9 protein, partial [Flavisolibacter sp.]
IPGLPHSYVFRIEDNIFSQVVVSALKAFYYQRASVPLHPLHAGKWHRSAGHPDDVVYVHASAATPQRPEGSTISSPHGWYDAGDYNKYIVNSGITMGTLLSAYEDFPAYYSKLETAIPESGDAVPDILNEVLYNLRWMLNMQDPFDGGVYHKLTNAAFDGMVMPGVTTDKRYVVQKSTAATLDFAAVMAQAARILKKFKKQFPRLADSCLNASVKAWQWAENNPSVLYDQAEINQKFKPAITTGAYGDRQVADEWFWAASELLITTKDIKYSKVWNARFEDRKSLPGWGNVAMLGFYSMIRNERSMDIGARYVIRSMKDSIIAMANEMIRNGTNNAFATIMGQSAKDFNWGGNANAANQSILLVQAYMISKDKKYLDAAITNLDYLLGRNATGYSFITGMGSRSPMHPHHRPSEADGIIEPVPGLLVGGPNISMQDKCDYPYREVETAYLDALCSYASNEIAINWNAPLVYIAGAMEALKNKAGYVK